MACPNVVGKPGNASCQLVDDDHGHIIGRVANQKLRYSDRELTLIYGNGEACRHNHFHRTTVINFHCNKSASKWGVKPL